MTGVQILITHTPPKYHLDGLTAARGCEYLRQALWTVRPLLHVFGHIHESRGVQRVRWDLDNRFVRYKEKSAVVIEDPAPERARMWVVDLTRRKGDPLDSDGTREGRRESCLVNAAVVKGPWKKGEGHGGRNKVVVVDVEVGVGGGVLGSGGEIEGMKVIEEE